MTLPTPDGPMALRERAYTMIEQAAIHGDRCPFNDNMDATGRCFVPELARTGRIRVEVYARNWRVVTLLTGEHKGKHTALPSFATVGGPYVTIDRNGTHHHPRAAYATTKRQQPSKPRILRADEL